MRFINIKMRLIPKPKEIKAAMRSETKRFDELSVADQSAFNDAVLKWETPMYIHKHKPWWWVLAALLLVSGLVIYGLLANAWTFSVAVVVFAGVYYYFQHQESPILDIVFSSVGVKVGQKVYPYNMFKTFWVDYAPPHIQDLHLVPSNNYKYELTIHLNGQDPAQLKAALQQFLPEWIDRKKTITESIIHITGL